MKRKKSCLIVLPPLSLIVLIAAFSPSPIHPFQRSTPNTSPFSFGGHFRHVIRLQGHTPTTPTISMTIRGEKLLWEGPLFGRLTKHAKSHLVRRGWRQQRNNDYNVSSNARLALIWLNKSGPQFEMDDSAAAHVRPYPTHLTDVLDDKIRSAELLSEGTTGTKDLLPIHIASLQEIKENKLYFVKHRLGAQGKNVYVYNHLQLREWWTRTGNNTQNFVVQEEVVPQTYQGKKFVMRSHILLWHNSKGKNLDDSKKTASFRCDILSVSCF
jgi:hypothetical protein